MAQTIKPEIKRKVKTLYKVSDGDFSYSENNQPTKQAQCNLCSALPSLQIYLHCFLKTVNSTVFRISDVVYKKLLKAKSLALLKSCVFFARDSL